jgi:hypothetical protein
MSDAIIVWDLPDDPDGNYHHIVTEGHGVTLEEVEEVLQSPDSDVDISRESGNPIAFGWTSTGKYIAIPFEHVCDDPLMVYPITAYPVPPPRGG